jgi:hypothetical protein
MQTAFKRFACDNFRRGKEVKKFRSARRENVKNVLAAQPCIAHDNRAQVSFGIGQNLIRASAPAARKRGGNVTRAGQEWDD